MSIASNRDTLAVQQHRQPTQRPAPDAEERTYGRPDPGADGQPGQPAPGQDAPPAHDKPAGDGESDTAD